MVEFTRLVPRGLRRIVRHGFDSYRCRREVRGLLESAGLDSVNGSIASEDELTTLRSCLAIKACSPGPFHTLIDIGAHTGEFSRIASKVFELSRVICIEPDTDLQEELRAADISSRVSVYAVAVGCEKSTADLHIHPNRSMNSLLPTDGITIEKAFKKYKEADVVLRSVPVDTLDGILDCEQIAPSSRILLKVDTQGSELSVLQGGRRTLEQTDACLVEFMFCTPYQRDTSFLDLVQFLYDHRFECRGPVNVMRRAKHLVSGVDFLFTRVGPQSTVGAASHCES